MGHNKTTSKPVASKAAKALSKPEELEDDQEHSGIGGFAEPREARRKEK